jgi:hypothetical protein
MYMDCDIHDMPEEKLETILRKTERRMFTGKVNWVCTFPFPLDFCNSRCTTDWD